MSVRDWVRQNVPQSTTVYESVAHHRRLRASRGRIKALEESGAPILLDIGGGDAHHKGNWLTVDLVPQCDIYWDLRNGIPFTDDRVERVYSSHVLEHIPFRGGQALLADVLRCLVPGGSLSICVPNAGMYLRAYVTGTELPAEYYNWASAYNETTAIDAVNYTAYMDGHHAYMFDEENLLKRLELAGFENVQLRDFDPELDRAERHFESIYAIGYKASR